MKQTFGISIDGRAYNIDNDAYALLERYFDDIASRLNESDAAESMRDIEGRVADIFDERITSPMQVVTVDLVRRATAVIGRPEMFGAPKRGADRRNSGFNSSTGTGAGSNSGANPGTGAGHNSNSGSGASHGSNPNPGTGADSNSSANSGSNSNYGSGAGPNPGTGTASDNPYFGKDSRRLYRSFDNRVIGGVCGGLADYFEMDPSLVRIIAAILLFVPPFPALLAYFVMWIVVPQAEDYVK
ncbi:MAG: PspC domain-containing protein [Alistipes sp.]|jgi:phage shock protein PspC (stress-responsive transcriptional regulator)|nr:PspC domain-containing protein [Alistipes sp.]